MRVMVRCPQTGRPIFTGVDVEGEADAAHIQSGTFSVGCPQCGDLHDWTAKDAWLETGKGVLLAMD